MNDTKLYLTCTYLSNLSRILFITVIIWLQTIKHPKQPVHTPYQA